MFFTGVIDTRKSTNCIISDYIVLVTSICLIVIIGFKFFAALQFSPKSQPEQHERFVICCVPSFTEGHKSLKETIDSLCESIYKKEKKLLFIIADGLIKGTGNDRTTPDIIMGILGTDKSNPAPPRVYHALGEDMKQLNLARVYSGQYLGVPYILVMKIGDVLEKIRPGNRGKRDSQLILMNFLSKCHADMPLNPLELELKYHFHYRIKVDPRNYEFLLWMDSDTTIYPDALSRFVSHMAKDSSISGICGETLLRNEDESWVTMIQVYEYFITHHLAKSFESLFGTVTCLPGCFCMYRIFHQSDMSPILVSPKIIQSYGENNVNTLHLKNLLSLGEDRYLTTLMLKSFPQHKLKFTPDAKAQTSAPSQWGVLLSQRRRWINSTVHNLSELMLLKDLCGCFVFSLRFVVIMDLFSTVMAPAGFLYVIYLIVLLCTTEMIQIPLISIIMICAIYGLQVLIFILKGEWQHIGWMILYILAIPVYSFVLPIYSFWHFDDFTWGSTRRVELDEEFGDMIVTKAKFDQSLIPQKSWVQYQRQDLKWRISQDKLLSPTQQQESTSGSSSSAYSLMEEDLKQKMLLLIPDILQNDSTASDAKIHNLLTNKLQRNIDEGLSKICIDQVRYVSSSEFEK
ncbi:chitin synthase-domain-containing protein [Globomyces pollinis-pini]|nr:chitin synthase-domain-containing protein [Globomyces pollinis-pini]